MDVNEHAQKYLEDQIYSATPQKLRLMLIEGAIRFARQTIELWDQGEFERALEPLIRARNIISELLSSIRPDQTELTQRVAGVYLFLFRSLTEAQLKRDRQKIDDVISVLEVERETWQIVCEKLPTAPLPAESPANPPAGCTEILAPAEGIGGPTMSAFSLDA